MDLSGLKSLLTAYESEHLELKRSTSELESGMKAYAAMLNGRLPGFVVFGVSNDGSIIGQDVSSQTLERIANHAADKIDPPAFPELETVALENGKTVIVVRVSGGTGLYLYEGRPYQRVGATTQHMPSAVYERRLLERLHGTARWENQIAEGFGIDDLVYRDIVLTVEEAVRRQRLDEPNTRDAYELLLGLGLLNDEGRLLNAAMVLFGRAERMQAHYPQCQLRMARFRGTTTDEFLDNRQEIGNAFEFFERAQRFMRDHLPVAGRIVPGVFERIDEPLYPTEALREAIANAICHRDYSIGGGAITIAIFDDRLEIGSAGPLPFGQMAEDLIRPHPSRPWNPLIAQTFYRRGIVEKWGRGTLKIIELVRDAGLVSPEFIANRLEVVVRFKPIRYAAPARVNVDLTPLQRSILTVLADQGPSTLSEILSALGITTPTRTVQNNLQSLRMVQQVVLTGKTNQARWSLATRPPIADSTL